MQYLNFDLSIEPRTAEGYPVLADNARFGQARTVSKLDVASPQMTARLAALAGGEMDPAGLAAFGCELTGQLLAGPVEDLFNRILGAALAQQKNGVRLRLRVNAPELNVLPWELMRVELEDDPLCISTRTVLTRYIDLDEVVQEVSAPAPLRLLGIIPQGSGLDTDKEKAALGRALAELGDVIQVTWLEGIVTRDRIRDAMARAEYHLVHFIGHGSMDGQRARLRLNDEHGDDYPCPAETFSGFFRDSAVRLVVLNACRGAARSSSDALVGVAPQLVRRGVPAVVAMQWDIADRVAQQFAAAFYRSLCTGVDVGEVDTAATRARSVLYDDWSGQAIFAAPVLFLRAEDGRLWTKLPDREPSPPAPKTVEHERRLDAAMPRECKVGANTEVRAMITLPESKGLRALLPADSGGQIISQGEVTVTPVSIEFPVDPATRTPLPLDLFVTLSAPGFAIEQPMQPIRVSPLRSSGLVSFVLRPQTSQPVARVVVGLTHDPARPGLLGSVALNTEVKEAGFELGEAVWQLAALPFSLAVSTQLNLPADRPVIEIIDRIREALIVGERTASRGEGSPSAAAVVSEAQAPRPPYMGLRPYTESEAASFFGRDALVARLVARVTDLLQEKDGTPIRFLAVVGRSGSGKSSVVRAGLLPVLRTGRLLPDGTRSPEGSVRWRYHLIVPASHPLEALAVSLTRDSKSVGDTAALIDDMMRNERSLHLFARRTLDSDSPDGASDSRANRRLFLVIDQFEEVFTACQSEAERRAFVENLVYAALADGPVIVVVVLRSDFVELCGQYPGLQAALTTQQQPMETMSPAELRQAIEEPARRGGWDLEPGLVDLILRDVGDATGVLPLLSHALLETWRRREEGTLTLTGYLAAGGLQKAISETADTVFGKQLSADQQAIARRIFLRLADVSQVAEVIRYRARLAELTLRPEEAASVRTVIGTLSEAGLITTDGTTAEVAHEALLDTWPTLRAWITENMPSLKTLYRLRDATDEWLSRSRDRGVLLRTSLLAEVEAWAKTHGEELNADERAFLDASLRERRREEGNQKLLSRLRLAGQVTVVPLVVALLILGPGRWIYAQYLRQQALRASPMAEIAGGNFVVGTGDPAAGAEEQPERGAALGGFSIEKTEVTNRQYRACVSAGACVGGDEAALGDPEKANHPVTMVNAHQAAAYCAWIGRRLPTFLEWERAARGPDGRLWPWPGDEPPSPETANLISGGFFPEDTLPVDSLPRGATPEGVVNLAGNVWEWVATTVSGESCENNACLKDWNGRDEVVLARRGGAWDVELTRITEIVFQSSSEPDPALGFRCAQSAQP